MEKKEMLELLINFYSDGNKAKFADFIGVTPQRIANWLSRNTFDLELIYNRLPDISGDWLLNGGQGSITRITSTPISQNDNNELIQLCKQLVQNYTQRDEVMKKLISILK